MSSNQLRENLLAKMTQADRARFEWNLLEVASKVYPLTPDEGIKRGCYLMACHMMGKHWCKQFREKYLEMKEIDWQIIKDEYDRLKEQGVI